MGIKIEKLQKNIRPYDNADVTVKKSGNIYEIKFMTTAVTSPIKKLNADSFIELSTGEVREFEHTAETRADNITTIKRSMAQLRDLINANVVDSTKCRWVTLTYARNETDTKVVYKDFNKFWKRFTYYCAKNNIEIPEYIDCIEPQGRGSFHHHLILIFQNRAPFIGNSIFSKIWKHGFTRITKLENIDNIGLYLSAYLSDLPVEEALSNSKNPKGDLKAVQATAEDGKKVSKAVVKGARLALYPAHFNFYRTSRGIKRPLNIKCTEQQAQRLIGDAPLTYEKTIEITENGNHINTINYRVYNKNKAIRGREKYGKEREKYTTKRNQPYI